MDNTFGFLLTSVQLYYIIDRTWKVDNIDSWQSVNSFNFSLQNPWMILCLRHMNLGVQMLLLTEQHLRQYTIYTFTCI